MTIRILLSAVVMLAWLPAAWGAQVYQWTDADGVKHYSNQKPPDSIAVDAVEKEIAHDPEAERLKNEKDAAVMREIETEDRRRQDAARATAAQEAARQKLEEKEAELDATGEKILNKRKYIGRHGRQDVNAYQRLDNEIESLKKDPNADPAEIARLESERDAMKEKIYNTPRRTRKGVGEDIKEYQELEQEVNELKQTTPEGADPAD